MEVNSYPTYYMTVADRAGSKYKIILEHNEELTAELLNYINGDLAEDTLEILFDYGRFVDHLLDLFANGIFKEYFIETARLVCWIKTQYSSDTKDVPFFRNKQHKRNIDAFYNYVSSLSENDLLQDKTHYAIKRRLRSIFPDICAAYTEWDYLYEIKEISTDADSTTTKE